VGMHRDTFMGNVIPANHTHLRVVDLNFESRRMIRCSICPNVPAHVTRQQNSTDFAIIPP
jgi:hypothetical protein